MGVADVPDGGGELIDRLRLYGVTASDDADDVAEVLQLDVGLVRYGISRLDDDVSDEHPVADSITGQLPPAKSEATAREVLVLASTAAPLTMSRAKQITRMSGDLLEDVLEGLVVEGRLVRGLGKEPSWVAAH
ncbi:hypothetical protein [Gordonia sp. MMO-8]|uniref:hypothetical protein n=1 Tax=Gordonia sp. MMO-8 TaxID=3127886 RepID=UPI00301703AE